MEHLFPPTKILNYEIQEQLGKGATSIVYKGIDKYSLETVAIKHVKLDQNSSNSELGDNKRSIIINEAEMLSNLKHPNIVKLINSFETSNTYELVLEYMECGSLETIVKKFGCLPEETVANLVIQILCVLDFLKEKNIAHRDLKGANLLLDKNGKLKLTDFGLAKICTLQIDISSTKGSRFAGTPYWMSPEMVKNCEAVSPATDIWSLGCTIVELITGNPPFHELNQFNAFFRIIENDIPLDDLKISEKCLDFLKKCFIRNPLERANSTQLLKHPWIYKQNPIISITENKLKQFSSLSSISQSIHQMAKFIKKTSNGNVHGSDNEKSVDIPRFMNSHHRPNLEGSAKRLINNQIKKNSDEFINFLNTYDKQTPIHNSKKTLRNIIDLNKKEKFVEYTDVKQKHDTRQKQKMFGQKGVVLKYTIKPIIDNNKKVKIGNDQNFPEVKMKTRTENENQPYEQFQKQRQMSCIHTLISSDNDIKMLLFEDTGIFLKFCIEVSKNGTIEFNSLSKVVSVLLLKGLSPEIADAFDSSILFDIDLYDDLSKDKMILLVLDFLIKNLNEKNQIDLLEEVSIDMIMKFLKKACKKLSFNTLFCSNSIEFLKLLIQKLKKSAPKCLANESFFVFYRSSIEEIKKSLLISSNESFNWSFGVEIIQNFGFFIQQTQNFYFYFLSLKKFLINDLLVVLLFETENEIKEKINLAIINVLVIFVEKSLKHKLKYIFVEYFTKSVFLKVILKSNFAHFGFKLRKRYIFEENYAYMSLFERFSRM